MSSTTIHIPDETLKRIDAIARRRRISRNRLVLEALEELLDRDAGEWPEAFFTPPADAQEREMLKEATGELETAVSGARRNRGVPLF